MKQVSLGFNAKSEFADWEVGEEYEVRKLIGSGSYGCVAEAIHKPTNKKVAIKKMMDIFGDSEDCKKMVREILLLKAMNSSNFVTQLLDIIEPSDIQNFKD